MVVTEPPLNPPEAREAMAEIMFETFNVAGLYVGVQVGVRGVKEMGVGEMGCRETGLGRQGECARDALQPAYCCRRRWPNITGPPTALVAAV